MTKQEQIEEMNTLMQEAYNNHCENVTCVECPYFDIQHGKAEEMRSFYCQNYLEANALYNAGYRKIDNDRYFDRKEYAKFFRTALEGCAEENIKSTAKEILNYLIECDVNEIGKGMIVVTYGTIEKLIAKYGVEIEE